MCVLPQLCCLFSGRKSESHLFVIFFVRLIKEDLTRPMMNLSIPEPVEFFDDQLVLEHH